MKASTVLLLAAVGVGGYVGYRLLIAKVRSEAEDAAKGGIFGDIFDSLGGTLSGWLGSGSDEPSDGLDLINPY